MGGYSTLRKFYRGYVSTMELKDHGPTAKSIEQDERPNQKKIPPKL